MNVEDWKKKMYIYGRRNTEYWLKEASGLKSKGVEEIFMVSLINNKWLKKVVKWYIQK